MNYKIRKKSYIISTFFGLCLMQSPAQGETPGGGIYCPKICPVHEKKKTGKFRPRYLYGFSLFPEKFHQVPEILITHLPAGHVFIKLIPVRVPSVFDSILKVFEAIILMMMPFLLLH